MTITATRTRPASEIPQLAPLLVLSTDDDFVALLQKSLQRARSDARERLAPALFEALPWPTTADTYVEYLVGFVHWIPQQSSDPAWLDPGTEEHQEVYDRLCHFYYLIDQPVLPDGGTLQSIPEFAEFLVGFACAWGEFLDSTDSFDEQILASFIELSPKYRVEDSMIPDGHGGLRPNAPSGWLTFNQFFARELNPGLRPILDPMTNQVITVPADCTYKRHFQIGPDGRIPEIVLKGTHTYASVQMLLEGSEYANAFNGGHFIHLFLGPYSYHRFHTPVAGIVKEAYPLTGQVFLDVSVADGQFDAADSATNGYEFQQVRGVLTLDTSESPAGNVGMVAVVPVGMCQVSGVNMTHVRDTPCEKGDEFGYFTFGGSDIIILLQAGTKPVWNPQFVEGTTYYSKYGTELARVTCLPSSSGPPR